MKELKRCQGSIYIRNCEEKKLAEDRDTILELTGKIPRDFQDAESVRSGQSHFASQPAFFTFFSKSWRNAKPLSGNAEPQRRAAKHLGHAWYIGKRFVNPVASSSAPYPQELNPWSSGRVQMIRSSTAEKNENQTPIQDQRCQSGPSAKSSDIPSEGDSLKNYGADQQRLQISDLHLDKFLHQQRSLVGR